MMNKFLPAGKTRRRFLLGEEAYVELHRQRLEAVRGSLEKVNLTQRKASSEINGCRWWGEES